MVIAFTVVVNGMSMSLLMKALKLTELSDERRFMVSRAYKKLDADARSYFAAQKKKRPIIFRDVEWIDVDKWRLVDPRPKEETTCVDEGKAAWLEVLNIERAVYLQQFETRRRSPASRKSTPRTRRKASLRSSSPFTRSQRRCHACTTSRCPTTSTPSSIPPQRSCLLV
jgi:hypothetical protein